MKELPGKHPSEKPVQKELTQNRPGRRRNCRRLLRRARKGNEGKRKGEQSLRRRA